MKKEIIEFKDIVTDLYAISESPNFSDNMRNKASELQYYINKNVGNLKPIIKKSGETFVALYNGVGYFCINPKKWDAMPDDIKDRSIEDWNKGYGLRDWKPILEIEITNEIAKFTPYCLYKDIKDQKWSTPKKLIHVELNKFYHTISGHYLYCQLATVADLDNQS